MAPPVAPKEVASGIGDDRLGDDEVSGFDKGEETEGDENLQDLMAIVCKNKSHSKPPKQEKQPKKQKVDSGDSKVTKKQKNAEGYQCRMQEKASKLSG